jgi:hypothetical protein
MLYVYAITDAAPDSLGIGLHGAPLRAIAAAGVFAIATQHEQPPQSGVEELWRHEEVVERLMEEVAALPMRFGASAASDAELEAVLGARADEFRAMLDRVRGAVELSVRVEPAPAAQVRGSDRGDAALQQSGTEYMRERGLALRSREEAEARYHEPLNALARRSHVPPGRLDSGAFKAAYLVEADRVEAFVALVTRLGEEGATKISCTGPWPPYSFVSGEQR